MKHEMIMIPSRLFGEYKMKWTSYLVYGYYAAHGEGEFETTQKETAEFFGMARETVAAINSELVLHGLIKVTVGKMDQSGRQPSKIEVLVK